MAKNLIEDSVAKTGPASDLSEKWVKIGSWALTSAAVLFSLFQIYSNGFALMTSFKQNAWHIGFALVLGFMMFPIGRGWWRVLDLICAAAGFIAIMFVVMNYEVMANRFGIFLQPEIVASSIIVVMVLELARRLLGFTLALLCSLFVIYAFFGNYLPGEFGHQGFPVQRIASYLVMTTDGIFGTATGVSATLISIFVIFGAFLSVTGCGQWFIDISNLVAGRATGGSAKVAVLASSLMGSISGSAAGNVATTGTFTIPMMKQAGFTRIQAGAIEAVASTGGTILPPLMGAGAFVMAELLGVQYSTVAFAAILPALMYYLAVFVQVDFMARRYRLAGFDVDRRAVLIESLKSGWRSIPLVILIWLILVERYSPTMAAFYAIAAALTLGIVMFRGADRFMFIVKSLKEAAQAMLPIAIACASAGIIVGVLMLTGLGLRMSSLMIQMAGGNLAILLVLTMVSSIILGMGVPATAAYIILATLAVPAMVQLGVEPLAAHMFVFYFGTISNITPPVAVAAFVAAGLSGGSPTKVAVEAFTIGAAAFLIPFMFVYGPQLLMIDPNWLTVGWLLLTTGLGIVLLSAAIQGWLFTRLGKGMRCIASAIAVLLVVQTTWSDIVGLVAMVTFVIACRRLALADGTPDDAEKNHQDTSTGEKI